MNESSIQPELLSLQAKLAGEIERDEKAIELAQKRVDKNRALLHAINASLDAIVAEATGGGSFADTVRAAIKTLEKDRFTSVDVDRAFIRHFPSLPLEKERIRNTLWNLIRRNEIKLVRKGSNQSPAEYERPTDQNSKRSETRDRRRTQEHVSLPDMNGHGENGK